MTSPSPQCGSWLGRANRDRGLDDVVDPVPLSGLGIMLKDDAVLRQQQEIAVVVAQPVVGFGMKHGNELLPRDSCFRLRHGVSSPALLPRSYI